MRTLPICLIAAASVLCACSCTKRTEAPAIDPFTEGIDNPIDSTLSLYFLRNGTMQMTVLNWGARIQSLTVDGTDVVLGFDTLSHYRTVKQNFGAVVGRYIGRILNGTYVLDGDTAHLQLQSSGDCGHGGDPNFGGRMWSLMPGSLTDTTMTLRYVSPDGENGFPGELTLLTTYTLTSDGLRIDYQARTTKPTVLNPSNHTFFNLTGDLSADVLSEELWIDSDSIALYDDKKKVTGQLGAVAGTPFDFRQPRPIGERIDEENDQLKVTGGYDHCYQLRGYAAARDSQAAPNEIGSIQGSSAALPEAPHLAARLTDPTTALTMEVFTTEPALQIYTANGHKGSIIGKGGQAYPRRNAICFETMHFPDSPNKPQWPSTALRPGETFHSTTIFKFR